MEYESKHRGMVSATPEFNKVLTSPEQPLVSTRPPMADISMELHNTLRDLDAAIGEFIGKVEPVLGRRPQVVGPKETALDEVDGSRSDLYKWFDDEIKFARELIDQVHVAISRVEV